MVADDDCPAILAIGYLGNSNVAYNSNAYYNCTRTLKHSFDRCKEPLGRIQTYIPLARKVPTVSTINIIPTSQFFNKVKTHEQVHLDQWNPGRLYGDLMNPDDFFNQIKNLTGTSRQDLVNKLLNAKQTYVDVQAGLFKRRISAAEREAHLIADPVAPQYIYQLCNVAGPTQ